MKKCTRCSIERPNSEFVRNARYRDGLGGWCRLCRNAYQKDWRNQNIEKAREYERALYRKNPAVQIDRARKWKEANPERYLATNRKSHLWCTYRMTVEEYDERLREQGGGCAICQTDVPGGKGSFHVDHDHSCCEGNVSCGQCVRGLLCQACNVALGKMQDDPDRLTRAALYLTGSL